MKKGLLIALLVVAILASVVTGTLAVYNTSLDEMQGDVISKAFEFESSDTGADNFLGAIKIAPTETESFTFSLQNFNEANGVISEVPMKVTVSAGIILHSDDDELIPLDYKLILLDEDGEIEDSVSFESDENAELIYYFPLKEQGVKRHFRIDVTWNETDNDTAFQGMQNDVKVNASAIQIVESDIPVIIEEYDGVKIEMQANKAYLVQDNLPAITDIKDCKFITMEQFQSQFPDENLDTIDLELQNAARFYFGYEITRAKLETYVDNDDEPAGWFMTNKYSGGFPYNHVWLPFYNYTNDTISLSYLDSTPLDREESESYHVPEFEGDDINGIDYRKYYDGTYYKRSTISKKIFANATLLACLGKEYELIDNYNNYIFAAINPADGGNDIFFDMNKYIEYLNSSQFIEDDALISSPQLPNNYNNNASVNLRRNRIKFNGNNYKLIPNNSNSTWRALKLK